MSNTYTCAACRGVFSYGWTEEEALAEKEENWGGMPMECMEIVCDDCYREMMGLPAALAGEKKDDRSS